MTDPQVSPGDMVQVFVHTGKEKLEKYLSAHAVLSTYTTAGTAIVPCSNGKTITATVEDTRHPIVHDDFFASVVEAIDVLSDGIDDIASSLNENEDRPIEVDATADDVHDQNDKLPTGMTPFRYALVTV